MDGLKDSEMTDAEKVEFAMGFSDMIDDETELEMKG